MDSSVGTVVIPAMGVSQRFKDHGYTKHKALLKVQGTPIIKRICDTVPVNWNIRVVVPIELAAEFYETLGYLGDRLELITLHGPTEGQSQTILRGILGLNAAKPVMVTNCDLEADRDVVRLFSEHPSSVVMCHFHPEGPAIYSYLSFVANRLIDNIAEKQRVGSWAQTGWWRFNRTGDLHKAIALQIQLDKRHTNGEFYLSGALQVYKPPLYAYCLVHSSSWRDYGTPEAMIQQGLEIIG